MKIFVTHASSFDFQQELYQPLRNSSLGAEHEIILPHETGNEKITKEIIREQDLVIAEVSYPSTGSGIELGWAETFGVPIVAIYKKGAQPSSSVTFITDTLIEYTDTSAMIDTLTERLSDI